jgi:beta-lactamase regulating signal transducer with metallopeptidase domain
VTAPYLIRLICLSLETMLLVNLASSALVLGLFRKALRIAEKMNPRDAARLFLGLRLFPFAFSIFAVAFLCIPSYLKYEQNFEGERIGWFCLGISVCGATICLSPIIKGIRFFVQLNSIENKCRLLPQASPSMAPEIYICAEVDGQARCPSMSLVGIVHPRLIVSQSLLNALSPKQLQAAILHERAHQASCDNLKRLITLVTPGILPFVGGLGALERRWEWFSELDADDQATERKADRSIALAEALVKAASLQTVQRRFSLSSALTPHDADLVLRVNRLVGNIASPFSPERGRKSLQYSLFVAAAVMIFLALLSQALHPFHELLESLLR